ncbi:MAG: hypothetical protein ACOYNO_03570 [Saprospiraceae bacterium]
MTCLFTIISEYKGGTYVHQVSAAGPVDAFAVWAEQMSGDTIFTADEKTLFQEAVAYSLSENSLVALDGLSNVWYEGFSLGDDLFEATLVATTETTARSGMLYTVMAAYRGGTYVSQHEAPNLTQACEAWQQYIQSGEGIPDLPLSDFNASYRERMEDRPPTPLTGLQHAWFFSVYLNKASVLVNVVETVPAMQ